VRIDTGDCSIGRIREFHGEAGHPMYETVTADIRVRVTPRYVEERSNPDTPYYYWAYTIEIRNEGPRSVQLSSRYWQITDATGQIEVVRGPGVVGKSPVLRPGGSFTYTSGCPLPTSSGIMVGRYRMIADDGTEFDVDIPAFSLDSPDGPNSVN
jgi:ApaG protein